MTLSLSALVWTLGCDGSDSEESQSQESDADTDSDTDTDTDSDADGDTDSDADGDTDADTDSDEDEVCDTLKTTPITEVDPKDWPAGTKEALEALEALTGEWTVRATCNKPDYARFDLDLSAPTETVGLFVPHSFCGVGRVQLTFDTSTFLIGAVEREFDGMVDLRLVGPGVLWAEYSEPLKTFVHEDYVEKTFGKIESKSADWYFDIYVHPDPYVRLGWSEQYDTPGTIVSIGGACWADALEPRK